MHGDMGYYDRTPKGLASNSGFEAEDKAAMYATAERELATVRYQMKTLAEQYAKHLWRQDRFARTGNEAMLTEYLVSDIMAVLDEHTKAQEISNG